MTDDFCNNTITNHPTHLEYAGLQSTTLRASNSTEKQSFAGRADLGLIHTGRGTRRHANSNTNPLMLLVCSVNTSIDDNRSHLLALPCASHRTSCVNKALGFAQGRPKYKGVN